MAANNDPIFSRVGSVQGTFGPITTAANDYTGNSPNNFLAFEADNVNGGYIQRLRFKATGATTNATVARIYINNGKAHTTSLLATPGTPTGTPSTTGGALLTGTTTYFAKIVAVDSAGGLSAISAENATGVSVTGPTGSIAWTWTASPGAVSYRVYVTSGGAGTEQGYFTTATNSFTQIALPETPASGWEYGIPSSTNNYLYGELSLPAIATASATAAMADIDYPMNIALPPGYEVYVGLGTAPSAGTAGWQVVSIGGAY